MKWIDREPYAYWKGNHLVASTRFDLLKCNVSQSHDWNARIYSQVFFLLHLNILDLFLIIRVFYTQVI